MKISYALLVSALACAAYAAPVEPGESFSAPLVGFFTESESEVPRLTSGDVRGPCVMQTFKRTPSRRGSTATEDTEVATGPVRSRFSPTLSVPFSCDILTRLRGGLGGPAGWRCYGWGWRRRCWRCPYGRCGGGGWGGGYGGGDGHHKRDVAATATDDKEAGAANAAAEEPVETDEMVEEPHDLAAECESSLRLWNSLQSRD